jgi:biotin carboxylase
VLAAVIAYERRTGRRPAAVVPVNDFVLMSGLAVATHYGLPYLSQDTIEGCREKDRLKRRLAAADVPVVTSQKFTSAAELAALAQAIGYPVVIKPLNFGGSGGVVRLDGPAEIETKFGETLRHVQAYARKYNASDSEFVVEPYIVSLCEVSVEVINAGGRHQALVVTDKYLSAEPHFSEVGHRIPSRDHDSDALKRLAERACAAMGVTLGMAHVEIKITADGPVVLEIGPRPAGDGIMDLAERSTGQNCYEWHCQAYLGTWTQPAAWPTPRVVASLAYLHPDSGEVAAVRAPAELDAALLRDVVRVTSQAVVGKTVVPAKDWSTRQGYVEYESDLQEDDRGEDLGDDLVARTNRLANALIVMKRS